MRAICISIIALLFVVVVAEAEDINSIMEGYRLRLPPPTTWAAGRGLAIPTAEGPPIALAHLRELGGGLKVKNQADLGILISYLRDSDKKIAYIAAVRFHAGLSIEKKDQLYPNPRNYFGEFDSTEFNSYVFRLVRNVQNFKMDK